MRIAIFGGTFNPVHSAHLAVAREARDKFALDEVLLVPAATPPHKTDLVCAPYEDRFRMVELACKGEGGLRSSRIEAQRERSFSILTIEELQSAHPDAELFFLIGADAFAEIRTWFRWKDVIRAVPFIVASRPGHKYEVPEGATVHRLDTLSMTVSSSDIRAALARGERPPELSAAVMDYIERNRLFGFRQSC